MIHYPELASDQFLILYMKSFHKHCKSEIKLVIQQENTPVIIIIHSYNVIIHNPVISQACITVVCKNILS